MPIKLIPPRKGFSPYYYGRGTHLGFFVDRSTKCVRPALAKRVITQWEADIERGIFAKKKGPTFLSAALAYKQSGGDERPVAKLIAHFGDTPLTEIGQQEIDTAALKLFPKQTPATRNREVYTPVSAILKGAGVDFKVKRPKGSRGRVMVEWLWPEQAERFIVEATKLDAEFGLLLQVLLYTGLRLSEATSWFKVDNLRLTESFAYVPKTKNGKPRPVYLPPDLVVALANHPRGYDRPGEKVFRFAKGGKLYDMLYRAAEASGIALPDRQAFHLFRHTYGTWMRRYGGADTKALVDTGAWDSEQSASRYAHAVAGEDAKRADAFPKLVLRKR